MAEETLRPFTLGLSVLLPIWGGHISLMRHAVTGRLKGTQGADLLSGKKSYIAQAHSEKPQT